VRTKRKLLPSGSACAVLLAVSGGLLAAGAGSAGGAEAGTIIPLPGLTYLTQTVPDTVGGNSYLFVAADSEIVVTNLAGKQLGAIDSGDGIAALALSANGGTLYASVTSGPQAGSIAAITVSSVTGKTPEQVFYPLAAGDQPGTLAVQSDKVWVGYTPAASAVGAWQIGAIDLAGGGAFEAAAAPGSWAKEPLLAADPGDTGVLVAVDHESPAEAATYKTTTDPATPRAAQSQLGSGATTCSYLAQLAVVPGGGQFAAACMGSGVIVYNTANLAEAGSYNANGAGASLTVGVAVSSDGAIAVSNRTGIYVYKMNGPLLDTLQIGTGDEITEGEGLAWLNNTDGPGLAAAYGVGDSPPYAVEIFGQAEGHPAVTFTASAKASFGHPITLSGTAVLPTRAPDTAPVTITRSGPGGTVTLPRVTPNSAGHFTATDTPKAVGTYKYTATSGTVSANATAKVTQDIPQVRETLSGQYGSRKSGRTTYLLYHRGGQVTVVTAVTPGHPGGCVEAETQEFYKSAWHAIGKTGCAKLNPASKATVHLTVAKPRLGYPYRVQAEYLSNSPRYASGASAWQYFMVEK
jgi:hypothetical protein